MAVAFKSRRIIFDNTSGGPQNEPGSVTFPGTTIRAAEVALKGYNIAFADGDHHVLQTQIDVDLERIVGDTVNFNVDLVLRDGSGHFDDRYGGWVEVLVIADVT
jgi:hypothetical protein